MARGGKKKITYNEVIEGMSDEMAAGIEVGVPVSELPKQRAPVSGQEQAAHLIETDVVAGTRVTRPHYVVENDYETIYREDGKLRPGAKKIMSPEMVEAIRQGYLCINCDEPQESPFPERCSLCGYRMGDKQQADFDEMFKGDKQLGPTLSVIDALNENDLRREKEAFDRVLRAGKSPMRGLRG